ncbi:MAG: UDP-N-acetylmuramate dehydrogenase, partial [Pseudolabrys sp.]
MSFPDIVPELKARMPELRGRLLANQSLGEFIWFRVGGPAQVFFMPDDENDLAYFLRNLPPEIPITVIGAGSNLIVRDGGVPGVVIRLGRGFNDVKVEDHRVIVGAAMLDVMVARAAQAAGVAGLAFLSGIPGTVGGALRMNGGAYGGETKDILIEARGVDRQGNVRTFSNGDMGFSYRHCGVPDDVIFTTAVLQGRAGVPDEIAAEMAAIKKKREASQPRNRTGGSTFKNPPGH